MVRSQFRQFMRPNIDSVRDGIVVEHAREACGLEHRGEVRLGLAPGAGVRVCREHHQPSASTFCGLLGDGDRLAGGNRAHRRDDRDAVPHGFDAGRPDGGLLFH